ncbi:MAG: SBBP repeat-containing protein [Blastocatellia bacterium]
MPQQTNTVEEFSFGGCVPASGETTCSGYASFVTLDVTTLDLLSVQTISAPIAQSSGALADGQGAVYITGSLPTSSAFPLVNPVQPAGGGGIDAFITVFAPVTRQIVFSTYIGGSGDDEAAGIALDPQGNIYIAGTTTSPNFPTKNAYQSSPPAPSGDMIGQGNSFIVKISSLGTIQTGPDFSLALAQSTVTASPGAKVPVTIEISRLAGLIGKVTVTPPSGLPAGIKLASTPESTKGTSVSFTIKVKGTAQPGSYALVFTGTDKAGQTHSATLTLVVQ